MSTFVAVIQLLLIPIGFISVGLLAIWIMRRRAHANQSPKTEAEYVRAGIVITTSSVHGGRVASGTLHGVRFILEAIPGAKATPPRAVITTPHALGGAFEVSREGSGDRYFKHIGLTSEVQTGDAEFDREFYLSGSRECLASLFGEAQARDAVRALFRLGFDAVALQGGKLSAVKPFCTQLIELDTLRSALKQLVALRATPGMRTAWITEAPTTAQIVYASVSVLIAGSVAFLAADRMTEPLAGGWSATIEDAWPVTAAAYLALGALAVFLLRGRPLAHHELFFGILFMALPGLGLGGWGGAMLTNQLLDRSNPREHLTQVESFTRTSRSNSSFSVTLAPWRAGGRSVRIRTHQNVHSGQRWIVRTHSGWLGYEWIESAQPAPDS